MKSQFNLRDSLVKNSDNIARASIFIIYFWFGILKVFDTSSATALVHTLFDQTLKEFMDFKTFFLIFGLFEVFIGISFLFKRFTNLSVGLFFLHIFTTTLPLFLLPKYTWVKFLVPTLEGQYILKNLVLIAVVIQIWKNGKC